MITNLVSKKFEKVLINPISTAKTCINTLVVMMKMTMMIMIQIANINIQRIYKGKRYVF